MTFGDLRTFQGVAEKVRAHQGTFQRPRWRGGGSETGVGAREERLPGDFWYGEREERRRENSWGRVRGKTRADCGDQRSRRLGELSGMRGVWRGSPGACGRFLGLPREARGGDMTHIVGIDEEWPPGNISGRRRRMGDLGPEEGCAEEDSRALRRCLDRTVGR